MVGGMSWLFRSRKKPPSATTPKASLDQQTLLQLAKAGGNLAMSTEVINYLYLRMRRERARQQASSNVPDIRRRSGQQPQDGRG